MRFVFPYVPENKHANAFPVEIRPGSGPGTVLPDTAVSALGLEQAHYAFLSIFSDKAPLKFGTTFSTSVTAEEWSGGSAQLAAFLSLVHGSYRNVSTPPGLQSSECLWATGRILIEPRLRTIIGTVSDVARKLQTFADAAVRSEARYFLLPRVDFEAVSEEMRRAFRTLTAQEFIVQAQDPQNRVAASVQLVLLESGDLPSLGRLLAGEVHMLRRQRVDTSARTQTAAVSSRTPISATEAASPSSSGLVVFEIGFAFAPKELEAAGWEVGADHNVTPVYGVSGTTDREFGPSVRFDLSPGTHVNHRIPDDIGSIDAVRFVLRDASAFMLYVRLEIRSRAGICRDGWFTISPGSISRQTPEIFNGTEWTVPAYAESLGRDWIAIDVEIAYWFQRTFQTAGYNLSRVKGVRIRDLATLARIEFIRWPVIDSTT